MPTSRADPSQRILEVFFYSGLFLVFIQLITDFVEAIYAFGLLGANIPNEIVSVLLFLSPVVLLFFPRGLPKWLIMTLGELALLCRALEVVLDTRGQMLVAGLGVACFLIFFPSLLKSLRNGVIQDSALNLTTGLAYGTLLLILLRMAGSGLDVTIDGGLRWVGWLLVIVVGAMLPGALSKGDLRQESANSGPPGGTGRTIGLSIGIIAAFILLYFAFGSPNVVVRWTQAGYAWVVGGILLVLSLFMLLLTTSRRFLLILTPKTVLVWNILFIVSLVLTILPHQLRFPVSPAGYPFFEPPVSSLAHLPLVLMILLFPVIYVDFLLLIRELVAIRPSWRGLGAGFTLGSFFLLLMILAHVFTTVYDYVPVIGPALRDRFWLVYLIAGFAMALPVLLVRRISYKFVVPPAPIRTTLSYAAVLIGIIIIAVGWFAVQQPENPDRDQGKFKILTYNIQQGYDGQGLKNFNDQLEFIRSIDPDIIGLQESDTNRIAGGNADGVRYFADRLKMYSYYGPKTVTGTFGVALLSKYPIQNPETFFMYSEGEQTATIQAQIQIGGNTFNVFVTHLGNGGPIVQQQAILKVVSGMENVILMGDFNFEPDTEQYQLTTQTMLDTWGTLWPQGVEDSGLIPKERIDHIFISPIIQLLDARYFNDAYSDHPALMAEIGW